MNKRLSEFEKEEIERLYRDCNLSFVAVARKLKRDERSVRNYLNTIGYVARSQSELQRKYPVAEYFFDAIDTEEKAYILGLFYADGYNNTNSKYACISLKEDDVSILNVITKIIQPTKPLFYLDMSPINRGMKGSSNQYRLTISNKHISERLVELGCGKAKTGTLKFPTLDQVPSSLIHHFVRGYFDGDGSISKGKAPKIDIISTPEFLTTLQGIMSTRLNIKVSKLNWSRQYIEANVCVLQIGGRLQCNRFMQWLYNDATIFLKRKKNVFDENMMYKIHKDEQV